MMLDSPHTSVAMLIRGTSLLQCVFHPTNHVQDIHPTDNPPLSARKSWAAVERHNVESDNNWRGSRAQPVKICVHWCMQSSAPAPGEQSPWDSPLGAIEGSISQCTFLQMTYTAENLHTDDRDTSGARPRLRQTSHSDPHNTSPSPTTTGCREDRS